ncbi:MAG TPA: V-type ATPase 116kDa subunit family protein, partial [Streptosporangiaceae bacterium]|nr:V-type ATPase 116kDa subunit family protein [Streptosporangiaceae bacterium]
MPWLEAAVPVRMERVALVAPAASLREVLVEVAAAGAVEIDPGGGEAEASSLPVRLLRAAGRERQAPALSAAAPDPAELDRAGRYDLLAGEAQLAAHADAALRRSGSAGLAGWMPADCRPELAGRIAPLGGALVPIPHPPGAQAPTLLGGPPLRRALMPLVRTYGTVPYADIDPSWLAWFSYVFMFGMMFGDAGQGILLVGAAVALRAGWPAWARRYRPAWPFVAGAGVSATLFGLLYGEFFGPTGVVPTLWLNPIDEPIQLLLAALAVGTVLLAGAYALGAINRWREGGWPVALYAPSGAAGISLFLGIGVAAGGWYLHHDALLWVGVAIAVVGLALAFFGFFAEAGGGTSGVAQALVELFDLVVRLGSNLFSFARLAAFGLMHAALGMVVWEGTTALWHKGGAMTVAAVVVFLAGNVVTFALEALVAAIQALRLEYYELFSRVFQLQGREFRPWHVPVSSDPVPVSSDPVPA